MPAADRGAFQDMLLGVKKCSIDGSDGSTLNFVESAKKVSEFTTCLDMPCRFVQRNWRRPHDVTCHA